MARPHQRVFALVAATLFLATSVATGVLVVIQIRKDNEQQQITEGLKQAQEQAAAQQQDQNSQGKTMDGFTPVASVSELQKIDLIEGGGAEAKEGDTITVHYTGALAKDGTIFESSKDRGEPATFALSGLIAGWQQGIPGMKEGGTRRLLIPASLAYGDKDSATIPANSDLVFDIELISISKQ